VAIIAKVRALPVVVSRSAALGILVSSSPIPTPIAATELRDESFRQHRRQPLSDHILGKVRVTPLAAKDSASAKQSRKNRKLSGQVPLSCPQPRSVRVQSAAPSTVIPCPVPSPRGVRVLEQSEDPDFNAGGKMPNL